MEIVAATVFILISNVGARVDDFPVQRHAAKAEIGSTFERNCQLYDGSEWSKCVWRHGDKYLEIARGEVNSAKLYDPEDPTNRVSVEASFTNCRLRVRDVDAGEDGGNWTCYLNKVANNYNGNVNRWQELTFVHLSVYDPPLVTISVEDQNSDALTFVVGKRETVRCRSFGGSPPPARLEAKIIRDSEINVVNSPKGASEFATSFEFTPTYEDVGRPVLIVCSATQPDIGIRSAALNVSRIYCEPRMTGGHSEYLKCGSSGFDVQLDFVANPPPTIKVSTVASGSLNVDHVDDGNGRITVTVPAEMYETGNRLVVENSVGSFAHPLTCVDTGPAAADDEEVALREENLVLKEWIIIAVVSTLCLALVLSIVCVFVTRSRRRFASKPATSFSSGSGSRRTDLTAVDSVNLGEIEGSSNNDRQLKANRRFSHLYEEIRDSLLLGNDEKSGHFAFEERQKTLNHNKIGRGGYVENPFKVEAPKTTDPVKDEEKEEGTGYALATVKPALSPGYILYRPDLHAGNYRKLSVDNLLDYNTLEFAKPNQPLKSHYTSSRSLRSIGDCCDDP